MPFCARNPFRTRTLVAASLDLACVVLALGAAHYFVPAAAIAAFGATAAVVSLGALAVLHATGAYDLATLASGPRTRGSLLRAMGIGFGAALLAYLVLPLPGGTADFLLHAAAVFFPLFLLEREVFRAVSRRVRKRVLLVGESDLARALAERIERGRELGLEVVGSLGGDSRSGGQEGIPGVPTLGPLHHLEKVIGDGRADWVVVTSKARNEPLPEDQLLSLKLRGVPIFSGVRLYERLAGEVYHRSLRSSVLIFDESFGMNAFDRAAKRALDLAVASVALVITSPILLLAAAAIRLDSKGPVFFRQTRVGRFHQPFRLVKLRTMAVGAEQETGPVFACREDRRVTRVGRFLRRTRIDELPQLWNVLEGDMSVVGPRPERPEFLDEISEAFPYFRLRSAFKPGITGWAQVRFGYVNDVDGFETKLALDLYYMRNRSLAMDVSILWSTLRTVFSLSGV